MASRTHDPEPLLTPAEVASMFRVDPKTVTRWAKAGKLSAIRTLRGIGQQSRLLAADVGVVTAADMDQANRTDVG